MDRGTDGGTDHGQDHGTDRAISDRYERELQRRHEDRRAEPVVTGDLLRRPARWLRANPPGRLHRLLRRARPGPRSASTPPPVSPPAHLGLRRRA